MSITTTSIVQYDNNGNAKLVPIRVDKIDESLEYEIKLLKSENEQLKKLLEYEKSLKVLLEDKVSNLEKEISEFKEIKIRKRRTKKEIESLKEEYSEIKSNGQPKAKAAEPIRSYEDFHKIENYFLNNNNIRDWMLWVVGVSLGLRISDLLNLKIKYFLNNDFTFKERITIVEQKTSKLNNCLITESVKNALGKYFDSINWNFKLEDYLFMSKKTKSKMREECGWRIISSAGKFLNLPLNIGSHTMRKSFANIAACVNKSNIDMNAITKIQGLLNHSDQRVTMKYLGTFQKMYDNARINVSDFVLGKTNINELVVGNNYTIDDIITKLDSLETKFFDNTGGTNEESIRNNRS